MPDLGSTITIPCTQCNQEIPAPIDSSTPARTIGGAPRLLVILDLTDLHWHLASVHGIGSDAHGEHHHTP